MSKSIAEINEKNWNHDVVFKDFPIGQKVKVVSACVDFMFFDGETGIIVNNSRKYLGIIVRFDDLRIGDEKSYTDKWGFNPKDLIKIEELI